MAKLFLSYAREGRELIGPIAQLLEHAGHEVWWDRRIFGGSDFSLEIARELDSADVVIVAWSGASVASHWVKDEAAEGRNRNRLVPLLLDGTVPPLGFRQIHGIDFSGWDGRGAPAALHDLLRSIDLVSGAENWQAERPATPAAHSRGPTAQTSPRRTGLILASAVAGAALLIVAVLLVARPWAGDTAAADAPSRAEPVAASPQAPAPSASGANIDGRWRISWTINGTPYRGTLVATGATARIELDATTSMGRQSVRQDCAVAGEAPIQVTCHNAEVVSGPPGYMADSFTFERRGDVLSGNTSDPLGLMSAPVTARRE
ncbi:toll/interleukin-1 receptor domain-containing protein [Sphingosinicella sp. YJ22]|uniref:toll/interleukin-1 receptor domain-containing protein n=1 Tax=Sphingosinicella sp. YJ22 TaxID=1104780 RepID=UPI00140B931A|nr:toll/interleukin-1 receptor domain-containing protein [Sphingosinicella sp. YJ22]